MAGNRAVRDEWAPEEDAYLLACFDDCIARDLKPRAKLIGKMMRRGGHERSDRACEKRNQRLYQKHLKSGPKISKEGSNRLKQFMGNGFKENLAAARVRVGENRSEKSDVEEEEEEKGDQGEQEEQESDEDEGLEEDELEVSGQEKPQGQEHSSDQVTLRRIQGDMLNLRISHESLKKDMEEMGSLCKQLKERVDDLKQEVEVLKHRVTQAENKIEGEEE